MIVFRQKTSLGPPSSGAFWISASSSVPRPVIRLRQLFLGRRDQKNEDGLGTLSASPAWHPGHQFPAGSPFPSDPKPLARRRGGCSVVVVERPSPIPGRPPAWIEFFKLFPGIKKILLCRPVSPALRFSGRRRDRKLPGHRHTWRLKRDRLSLCPRRTGRIMTTRFPRAFSCSASHCICFTTSLAEPFIHLAKSDQHPQLMICLFRNAESLPHVALLYGMISLLDHIGIKVWNHH
jgi:hypothetical protein